MSISLRVEHAAGGTSTADGLDGQWTHDLDEQSRAEIRMERSNWSTIESSLDRRNDELYLVVDGVDEFGGRFGELLSSGAEAVAIEIDSPEIDMLNAEPTGDNYTLQNVSDTTIVTNAINNVSTISAGAVATLVNSVGFTASHASWGKVVRDVREFTGGELFYDGTVDPWTVDYVNRLGTDKSASVTLGPANQNIGTDFRKTVDEREEVTHVRALGAQQGPDQLTAEAVASSYAGGVPIWRKYPNKEVIDQDRLQEIATTLVNEYDGEPRSLQVECTVYDTSLAIGDTVSVDYPEEDIDRSLRIVSRTERADSNGRTLRCTLSNRRLTREDTGAKALNDLQRFNRGYQGFVDRDQVTSGWNPAGDTVAQELVIPAWPDDIVSEQRVDLVVEGRAWRSPVSAAGHTHNVDITHPSHTHDVTHPSHSHSVTHPSHTHDVTHPAHSHSVTHPSHDHTISTSSDNNTPLGAADSGTRSGSVTFDSWTDVTGITPGADTSWMAGEIVVANNVGSEAGDVDVHVAIEAGGIRQDEHILTVPYGATSTATVWAFGNWNGEILTMQIERASGSGPHEVNWAVSWDAVDRHTHDVADTSTAALGNTDTTTTELGTTETSSAALGSSDTTTAGLGTTETSSAALGTTETATSDSASDFQPEVVDSFNTNQYYPTDVEVRVNGTLITTLAGTATAAWQETVGLTGQLTAGQNEITALPTTQRGEINLHLTNELFRRGPQSN